jgi:hypothetical protein
MTDETEDWAKVLGELIADHELKITERMARAAMLPPELAEQVASAVRLLHELPPVKQRDPGNS